jgi:hypothetical protein
MKDLFGVEIDENSGYMKFKGKYQKMRYENKYRRARKDEGNRLCKNCKHHYVTAHNDKFFHKCELIGFSFSEYTDIRLSFTCDKFLAAGI